MCRMLCIVRFGDDMNRSGCSHFDSGEAKEADAMMWRMLMEEV